MTVSGEGELKKRVTVTAKTLQCPREKSDMTPCICRDGENALTDDGVCVGCLFSPIELLQKASLRIANLVTNIEDAKKDIMPAFPQKMDYREPIYDVYLKVLKWFGK